MERDKENHLHQDFYDIVSDSCEMLLLVIVLEQLQGVQCPFDDGLPRTNVQMTMLKGYVSFSERM